MRHEADTVTCPGLLSGEPDQIHFTLFCEDCDAWRLARRTLAQVEDLYHTGYITQDEYEAYTYVWATSAPRYGSYPGWSDVPTIPAVLRIARKLTAAQARLTTGASHG